MSGFINDDARQAIINEMEDNTVVIFADIRGAKIYAKLRGTSAHDIGVIFGAVKASINRQTKMVREQIMKLGGPINDFIDGFKQGEETPPVHEGLRFKEFTKQENDNG